MCALHFRDVSMTIRGAGLGAVFITVPSQAGD